MKALNSKVALNEKARAALEVALNAVMDGFSAGKVTKSDLVSWILVDFEKNRLGSVIESIRKAHFDKASYLATVAKEFKKAQKNGSTPNLEELLAPLKG
jgi:hypothetical protein